MLFGTYHRRHRSQRWRWVGAQASPDLAVIERSLRFVAFRTKMSDGLTVDMHLLQYGAVLYSQSIANSLATVEKWRKHAESGERTPMIGDSPSRTVDDTDGATLVTGRRRIQFSESIWLLLDYWILAYLKVMHDIYNCTLQTTDMKSDIFKRTYGYMFIVHTAACKWCSITAYISN